MRILRIQIKNYRGVENREVRPSPTGITVIQGPNEIGKSSLLEAVHILFDHLDSSTKKEVLSLKPVHKDVGAEIEADIESGPYAFTYFKKFHKRPETSLKISRPSPESLTGREAHERVEGILSETMDLDLWRALGISQGAAIGQADLEGKSSLIAALDRAAGGSQGSAAEETLFGKVSEEHALYYSDKGGEKKLLTNALQAVDTSQQKVQELEAGIQAVERDVEVSRTTAKEIATLIASEVEQGEHSKQLEERLRAVRALQSEAERQIALFGQANAKLENARKDLKARERLRQEVEQAHFQRKALLDGIEASTPDLKSAMLAHEQAVHLLAEARAAHDHAEATANLQQGDHTWRRDQLDLEQLRERQARIRRAVSEAKDAQAFLDATRITDALLKKIKDGHVAFKVAKGQFEAGSPTLKVEALTDVTLRIDGKSLKLKVGEISEQAVTGKLRILVPDELRIDVAPGVGAGDLVELFQKASAEIKALLEKAGVDDLDEAERANARRLQAKHTCENRDGIVREALRDLTLEIMDRKIAGLAEQVSRYEKARPGEPPPAKTLEKAEAASKQAGEVLANTQLILRRAQKAEETTGKRLGDLQTGVAGSEGKREVMDATLTAREAVLAEARTRVGDEDLTRIQAELDGKVGLLDEQMSTIQRNLSAEDPEKVQNLAENAKAVLAKTGKRLKDCQDLQIVANTRLEQQGERGLWERLHEAKGALERAEMENTRLRVLASAARLLYEILSGERDRSRARYIAPLQERIQRLGRYVFGVDFQVELDENLAIASRTASGRTVPFKDLSVGAKEQLDLIARLACALLVSQEGGPLLLDDALGSTDKMRLEAMGAVLAVAGRETQVIILTCMPERYQHVGGATVLSL